jgi:hypothetical protein
MPLYKFYPPHPLKSKAQAKAQTYAQAKMTRKAAFVVRAMELKMMCLWKPAQSGKTRTIQQMIRADDGVKNDLNIVICSNNRLLVAQTRSRMHNELYSEDAASLSSSVSDDTAADDQVVGGVYSWMSGTKKSNISSNDLGMRVLLGEVSMIVCCSHPARFRYLYSLLDVLEKMRFAKPVNVWIDEADASVKQWTKPEVDLAQFDCVKKMTLVSATFGDVFKHFSKLRVSAFPETHPECYRGLADCSIEEEPELHGLPDAVACVEHILGKYGDEIVQPGVCLFAPGNVERASHEEIARNLNERGFVVLLLNGEFKGFLFPDGRRIPLTMKATVEDPDELSETLADFYEEYELENVPFAVTGYLCLGRGITFQSSRFLFDYAILPTIRKEGEAYQCVARVFGNIGAFATEKPVLFMSSPMKTAVERQEKIAMNIARLVYENGWTEVGEDEIAEAAGEEAPSARVPDTLVSGEVFATVKSAKEWSERNLLRGASAMYPCDASGGKTAETHFHYRGGCRAIVSLAELKASGDLDWGQGGWDANVGEPKKTGQPRIMPVLVGGEIRFVVVYKRFYVKRDSRGGGGGPGA